MNAILKYRGRTVTDAEAAFIRELIAAHPGFSRRRLSEELCRTWNWVQPNGQPRDMICRGLMLALHRAGHITLPPPKFLPRNPLAQRCRPAPVEIDCSPVEGSLQSLGPLHWEQVRRTRQEPLFNSLLEQFHYLGYTQPVGEHLKYLVSAQSRPLACLAWSSAPRHLGPRDRFIGQSAEARRKNVHWIATNLRFLVLPWVKVPHLVYHDDTNNRILELMGKRLAKAQMQKASPAGEREAEGKAPPDPDPGSERRGIFTSGIVSTCAGQRIALFFTGRKHAGENVRDVLAQRAKQLAPPIQMCDPLSRNMPAELSTILANCLAHGRRQFVDVVEHFPDECRQVLEALKVVYQNDEHLVEPNSGLGEAITYMLKRWDKFTLFLRQPGAPLDNNLCERALKKVILHRKNAMFHKTENGAHAGDLYMSLIYTCKLCGANPFDYLTELQRHAQEVAANPACWMPWNYRQTLAVVPAVTSPPAIAASNPFTTVP